MRISKITIDRRKRQLLISAGRRQFAYPFALIAKDAVVLDAHPDPETGDEAMTLYLGNGKELTIHLDDIRAQLGDTEHQREMLLYELTLQAQAQVARRGIAKRSLCRLLGTSPAQVYRLLDQTCYTKTIDQMLRLLNVLGCTVRLDVSQAA